MVAGATSASGSGIDKAKLDHALATAFAHLYADSGPGNDWRCVVKWHLSGSTATCSAIYQLDVTPDGRYVADGDAMFKPSRGGRSR